MTGSTMMLQRRRLAQAGGDLDVVGGHVGEQDALLLQGGLADQALAQPERVADVLALAVGVAGQQLQARLAAVACVSIM